MMIHPTFWMCPVGNFEKNDVCEDSPLIELVKSANDVIDQMEESPFPKHSLISTAHSLLSLLPPLDADSDCIQEKKLDDEDCMVPVSDFTKEKSQVKVPLTTKTSPLVSRQKLCRDQCQQLLWIVAFLIVVFHCKPMLHAILFQIVQLVHLQPQELCWNQEEVMQQTCGDAVVWFFCHECWEKKPTALWTRHQIP